MAEFGSYIYYMRAQNPVRLMTDFPDFRIPGFDIKEYNRQFRENNMIICARTKDVSYDKHWGCLSLKFVTSGKEFYETDHSRYGVDQSNFLLLNRDTEYSSFIHSQEMVESFTLNFSDDFTRSVLSALISNPEDLLEGKNSSRTIRVIERLYPREKNISFIAFRIHSMLTEFKERHDEIVELFAELLIALLKLNKLVTTEIDSVRKVKASTKKELYKRLNYAKDFIDTCYCEELNLDRISSIACMNKEYFIRQFKVQFGITPSQYLMRKRMSEASSRLIATEDSIFSICQEVGYSDVSSFGKLFKRIYRTNPENFRSTSRNQLY